jgi:aerobic-type carbon monoxide dehydrogenase small subunit (CoxS/CutS family)
MITLTVNGTTHTVEAAPDTPLMWVLREHLKLTGTKYGCGIGKCGTCAVHLNGQVAMSCQVSVGKSAGAEITTIEGLGANGLHPIQKAFIEENVTQCGFCIPGQIMVLSAMLDSNPEPTDNEIDLALKDNLCRCGAYTRIRKAVHRAAGSAG